MQYVLQTAHSADPGATPWRPARPLWHVRPSAERPGAPERQFRAVAVEREPFPQPARAGISRRLLGGLHVVPC